MPSTASIAPHSLFEDALALFIGSLLVALGVLLLREAQIPMAGTVGIAYLAHYTTGWNFGALFFVVNLPSYWLAWRGMGRAFAVKTFVAVTLLSLITEILPRLIEIGRINSAFAALAAGVLVGTGLLILIRHRASLGGLGVLAVYWQERRGWRAGKVQMVFDMIVLSAAAWVISAPAAALSVLASAALNMVIGINHRHGRYMGC